MRAALVRELTVKADEMLKTLGPADANTLRAAVARNFLRHVKLSPQRAGNAKNELFQAVARELAGKRGQE